ncbi:MAG: glycosyl transferase family 28 [Sphingobacteriales bacterium]|nr:MAG: glycosyl transferase family 28 [Sphingobacteriales bacterium]
MGIRNPKKILVAPLDWGLGHTTRCAPIIRHLLHAGHDVTVAGNAAQTNWLSGSFPGIRTIPLDGYNIRYGRTRRGLIGSILRQIPHILKTISREHQWLLQVQKDEQFDGIISDNRYGLHHPEVPSVIMTHQLQIHTGMGLAADSLLRSMHYRYLQRFSECWVVDVPGQPNLSGSLAHPPVMPANGKYIGLLSQLDPARQQAAEKHLLVLLSGPEPQRSLLSDLLWQQVQGYDGSVAFVEGGDDISSRTSIPSHITYYTRITKDALQPLLTNAGMVVCRSGYSTLMDLACLGKKAILIPTPGQTEQEYLGRYLQAEQVYLSMPQEGFNLNKALQQAKTFPYRQLDITEDYSVYKVVLNQWVDRL